MISNQDPDDSLESAKSNPKD